MFPYFESAIGQLTGEGKRKGKEERSRPSRAGEKRKEGNRHDGQRRRDLEMREKTCIFAG